MCTIAGVCYPKGRQGLRDMFAYISDHTETGLREISNSGADCIYLHRYQRKGPN